MRRGGGSLEASWQRRIDRVRWASKTCSAKDRSRTLGDYEVSICKAATWRLHPPQTNKKISNKKLDSQINYFKCRFQDFIIKSNENRKKIHTQKIKNILGSLRGKKIAFLGVTFKPNTDDMRDSVSLKMIPYLCNNGCQVFYCDPTGPKKDFNNIKEKMFLNGIDIFNLLVCFGKFSNHQDLSLRPFLTSLK